MSGPDLAIRVLSGTILGLALFGILAREWTVLIATITFALGMIVGATLVNAAGRRL